MPFRTPIERATSQYCADWPTAVADDRAIARINPEVLTSKTPGDFAFRYVDIGSVTRGTIVWDKVETIRFRDAPSRARRVVGSGDTLICTVRPLLRSHAYAGSEIAEPTVCSTGFAVLRCCEGLLPEFARHLPFTDQVARQLAAWQCGTNYPAVNERDMRRLVLPVPPRVQQDAIAGILNQVDEAIDSARRAIGAAAAADHSLLHELLEKGTSGVSEPHRNHPRGWHVRRLDEVADVGSGLTLGKDVSGTKCVELPYLRVANVQDGRLDLFSIKTVRVPVGDVDRFRLRAGDVLMTEGGDIDKLGRGALWDGRIDPCLHQNHVFRIRARRDLLESEFYALVVESDVAKRYFSRVAKQTTNLASTNKTQVRAFQFPIPPTLDEQGEIVTIIGGVKRTLAALRAKEEALMQLKAALLGDLLSGVVHAGTDIEPALSTA